MEYRDYYDILGIDRDATQDAIKQAYRRLARKYHPDVSKEADADTQFKDLGEAYEVLKDPESGPPTTNSAATGNKDRTLNRHPTGMPVLSSGEPDTPAELMAITAISLKRCLAVAATPAVRPTVGLFG